LGRYLGQATVEAFRRESGLNARHDLKLGDFQDANFRKWIDCRIRTIASYRGMLLLLLQAHIQFQIVTPRTLSGFAGSILLLPDVRVLSDAESSSMRRFQQQGKLVLTGHPDV
jgi:hypothetical protein